MKLIHFNLLYFTRFFTSSVANLFLEYQVQAKFLSSTLNAFLWDHFQNYQVQKFENQVFNTNLSSTLNNSDQNQVLYLKIKCSWSHYSRDVSQDVS